jgi:Domain of unknown function (DUF1906)/Bacterial SH3 domain
MPSVIDADVNCAAAASCLRQAGITTVFRYYSEFTQRPGKRLTGAEAAALAAAGLRLGAVYQDAQNAPQHFSLARGLARGAYAYRYAEADIAQPPGSAVYFSVDFDASEAEVDGVVLPFFQGIAQAFAAASGGTPDYRIGIYGSGLVCQLVLDAGLAACAWLAASRGWRETARFDASGRWHLKQDPEATLCGLRIDTDEVNPAQPDFGDFVPDPALLPPVAGDRGTRYRVTARDGLRLRAGPGTDFDVTALLAFGRELRVVGQSGDWAKVDLEGDGQADGFVHVAFIEAVA